MEKNSQLSTSHATCTILGDAYLLRLSSINFIREEQQQKFNKRLMWNVVNVQFLTPVCLENGDFFEQRSHCCHVLPTV